METPAPGEPRRSANKTSMKHDFRTYLILLSVIFLAFGSAYIIPASELLKATIAAPGVVSLLAALFQLMRDQASYEKQLDIQSRQFQFTLGAASHMANIAFDKHVDFCERYMSEIHDMVHTFFREGETEEALTHARKLYALREQYATWLTDEINSNLDKFESTIRKIGSEAHFIKVTTGDPRYSEQRSLKFNSSFELFKDILGIDPERDINEDYAVEAIKRKVKGILGIEELTMLRAHLVKEASNVLKNRT